MRAVVSSSAMSVTLSACLFLSLVACVFGQAQNDTSRTSSSSSSFRILSRAFDQCSSDTEMFSCLKVKAVKLLDRALKTESLPVSDFLSFVRDPSTQESPASDPLDTALPRDLGEKNMALDQLILERIKRFLDTRSITISAPKDVFEGRHKIYKKSGKGGGLLLVFGMFAAMMLQLAYGKIALVAGKALLLGKVALLIAGVVGLKSLLTHRTEPPHPPQVIVAEPEHHLGWGRSAGARDGHDLAYSGHRRALKH